MKPFLKWVGGKQRLLPELVKHLPDDFAKRRYIEPFVGGGALFFHLALDSARSPLIADANPHLIRCYRAVARDVEGVIKRLRILASYYDEHGYHQVRNWWNAAATSVEDEEGGAAAAAAAFIYLNKTCFNGLWRVNKQGKFNVPMGDYKDPKILDEELLREASVALRHTTIVEESFYRSLARSEPENFFYLDPPYAPTSATADFTSYTKGGFTLKDQEQLAKHYRALDSWGCKLMISNSDAPLIWKLYHGFNFHEVSRSGTISSKGSARGRVPELIITNY